MLPKKKVSYYYLIRSYSKIENTFFFPQFFMQINLVVIRNSYPKQKLATKRSAIAEYQE